MSSAARTNMPARTRLHAFTIIEVMVTVGIVGVLIAIAAPALRGARVRAHEMRSLVNARDIASDMASYTSAFGVWPFLSADKPAPGQPPPSRDLPAGLLAVPWWPEAFIVGVDSIWSLATLWPGLVSRIAPWEEHFGSWVSPGSDDTGLPDPARQSSYILPQTSYIYSNSFIASPALWSGGAVADESLIAPTKPSDVAFPANKVLVWDGDLAYLPRPPRRVDGHWFAPTPMAFADGHAAVRTPADAAPGVANPLNNNNSTRLHNTPEGVLGRDF